MCAATASPNSSACEFALLVIERTASMPGRDPMRRCLRKRAKALIEVMADQDRAAAKGWEHEVFTVERVCAELRAACEEAATWMLTSEGRFELDALLRTA